MDKRVKCTGHNSRIGWRDIWSSANILFRTPILNTCFIKLLFRQVLESQLLFYSQTDFEFCATVISELPPLFLSLKLWIVGGICACRLRCYNSLVHFVICWLNEELTQSSLWQKWLKIVKKNLEKFVHKNQFNHKNVYLHTVCFPRRSKL